MLFLATSDPAALTDSTDAWLLTFDAEDGGIATVAADPAGLELRADDGGEFTLERVAGVADLQDGGALHLTGQVRITPGGTLTIGLNNEGTAPITLATITEGGGERESLEHLIVTASTAASEASVSPDGGDSTQEPQAITADQIARLVLRGTAEPPSAVTRSKKAAGMTSSELLATRTVSPLLRIRRGTSKEPKASPLYS
ncbi:MAG: hypothetical protein ACI9WU_005204 [Myxococcota bacterium]